MTRHMTPEEQAEYLASFVVDDTASAEMFVYACQAMIGLGFHPDTTADEYRRHSDGDYTFTPDQALRFDRALQAAFVYLDDIYTVSLEEAQRLWPDVWGTPDWPTVAQDT